MPTREIVPGADEIAPVTQGCLSRLCGLYSLINAVQLTLYPQRLTKAEQQALYLHGIHCLARRRQLHRVVGVGMHEIVWLALAGEIVDWTNETYGTAIKLQPPVASARPDRRRALELVRKSVRDACPVLASLGGALGHYTVISGYTDQRLLLFDSSGLRWIAADKIGLGENSSRRHWVTDTGLISVVDDW